MITGYARVSTREQDLTLQREALTAAGCSRIYAEKISGARADRPQLARLLKALEPGDQVIVTRLDRLGARRSISSTQSTSSPRPARSSARSLMHGATPPRRTES